MARSSATIVGRFMERLSIFPYQNRSQSSVLWVPSQRGSLPVCLQAQRKVSVDSSAVKTFGTKRVPLCLPSQNGWPSDSPQVQNAYFWPAFSSTLIGALPAMVGLSDMWNSNWDETSSEAWNDSFS